MAQLNVAREPSMDEILASIRKIIESNEPSPAGTSARQTFEDDAGDDIELSIDSEIEADAFGSVEDQFSSVRTSPSAVDTVPTRRYRRLRRFRLPMSRQG